MLVCSTVIASGKGPEPIITTCSGRKRMYMPFKGDVAIAAIVVAFGRDKAERNVVE